MSYKFALIKFLQGALRREWLKLLTSSLSLTLISKLEYYVPKINSVGSREEVSSIANLRYIHNTQKRFN